MKRPISIKARNALINKKLIALGKAIVLLRPELDPEFAVPLTEKQRIAYNKKRDKFARIIDGRLRSEPEEIKEFHPF